MLNVPDFNCNLLSVSKVVHYLELTEREKAAMVVLRKYDVWYKKLGHTSEVVLRKIQQIGDVGTCSQFCDSCI